MKLVIDAIAMLIALVVMVVFGVMAFAFTVYVGATTSWPLVSQNCTHCDPPAWFLLAWVALLCAVVYGVEVGRKAAREADDDSH